MTDMQGMELASGMAGGRCSSCLPSVLLSSSLLLAPLSSADALLRQAFWAALGRVRLPKPPRSSEL